MVAERHLHFTVPNALYFMFHEIRNALRIRGNPETLETMIKIVKGCQERAKVPEVHNILQKAMPKDRKMDMEDDKEP